MDPAPGTVEPHSNRTDETESKQSKRDRKQHVPATLETMVIDQREHDRTDEPNSKPRALLLQEIKLVAMTVRSIGACTVKHHQTKGDQNSHCKNQNVCALS